MSRIEHESASWDAIFRERLYSMTSEKDSLQEITTFFEQLCRLHAEGQHDLAPLIEDTWQSIQDLIESDTHVIVNSLPRIMVRSKRDK